VSRSTLHSVCADVAWQKQLRDRYLAEGTPPVPDLDVKRAQVRRVGRHLAEQIILKYEWLGTMSSTSHHYGIFYGSYCAGVCCVAVGSGSAGSNVHKMFGLDRRQVAMLARGACVHWAPTGSNSKLVSWTCRLLSRETAARVVIAYSDTDAGEIGTIYQACNWTYIGRTRAARQVIAPNCRILDEKFLHDRGKPQGLNKTQMVDLLRSNGWRIQPTNPKHRYVCVLDKSDAALVARVEAMRQPYPKRPRSIVDDAPGIQPGEDGSLPILGLHDAAPTAHAEAAD
jgi:hypothetical protein